METDPRDPALAAATRETDDVVLSIEGISKKFCRSLKRSLWYGIQDITAELSGFRQSSNTLRKGEFWALQNINFQLRRGESLGLVGANGAGKTTLLRIISGLIKPDTGKVTVKGRVAPLIALGAGFNPILTGRENIYANMSILGLSKQEIDECFDEVVEFAEIGDAIDAPLQTYSSGMAARLGFSSAIYTNPDILLIDEVLAVGDMKFRTKCYRKLAELREKKISFILVSHNSVAILSICSSAIYLVNGKLTITDSAERVLRKYENDLFMNSTVAVSSERFIADTAKSSGLQIKYVGFKDEQGNTLDAIVSGYPVYFWVGCKIYQKLSQISLNILIKDLAAENKPVLLMESMRDGQTFSAFKDQITIQLYLPYCGLKPGVYSMKIYLTCGEKFYILDMLECFIFKVVADSNMTECSFYQPRSWQMLN